jgi:hypothetical protein
MMKIFIYSNLLFILLSSFCFAEYRVYHYIVKNRDSVQEKDVHYEQLSTLNPVAFQAYSGGRDSIKVDLLRTWICPGHTGGKKQYCPSPYEELKKEVLNGKN